MKIAMIGQKAIPFSQSGGVERHVEELATRLAKAGHEVTVYVRPRYVATKEDIWQKIKLVRVFSIPTKHLDTISYTFFATLHAVFHRGSTSVSVTEVEPRRPRGFDIIHYHGVGPSLICWIPRLFTRAKIVVTFHSLDRFHSKWGPFSRLVLRLGEWTATHLPHATIAVSKSIQKYCQERFDKKIIYIPNGVVVHKIKTTRDIKRWGLEKDKYLLTVARLVKHKGIHHLIKAYQAIPDAIKGEMKLVIVGAPSFTKDYDEYLKELAGEDYRIVFAGHQSGEALAQLYANAYLYVHPSEYEGLSIAILEAMSYGKCAVVSNIPENKEVIDHSGIAFRVGDAEDLTEKLSELMNHPEIAQTRAKLAQGFMKAHYSWETIVEKIENLYKSLMSES